MASLLASMISVAKVATLSSATGLRKTIVKDRRKELGPGLIAKMIRDLGLERSAFR